MAQITIYTTSSCPYCSHAKQLLARKGLAYDEIDVGRDPALRARMTARAGGHRTVPQIFIGTIHIGGSDELHALDETGGLDSLVASP